MSSPHSLSLLVGAREGGHSILDQHFRIGIEPGASGRCTTHSARSVTLTTGLNPDDRIDEAVVNCCGWTHAETGRAYIAPSTAVLPRSRHRHTALVDDEMLWHIVLGEVLAEG